jgi:uracil-DNA glycosylase family 4
VVLVGEAPGQQEVVQQRPFVGQAGKNLDEFLEILEIKREDIYITNVVKFRPVKN